MPLINNSKYVLTFLSLIIFAGCGGGSETESNLPNTPNKADEVLNSIDNLKSNVQLPPSPSDELRDASISGVDLNSNGIRDEVEIIIFQSIRYRDGENTDYNILLEVARALHPPTIPVPNAIDEMHAVCLHRSLNRNIREAFDYDAIFDTVINTKERWDSFKASSKDSTLEGDYECI